ncbi:MAG: hypothetical protein MZU84_06705 [Sphingobacterium sp.]|nr:hypothetical protein [Sphingobacterium sp.]
MKLSMRPCPNEDDYFRVRNFLREVFLLNDRLEHSWNVARTRLLALAFHRNLSRLQIARKGLDTLGNSRRQDRRCAQRPRRRRDPPARASSFPLGELEDAMLAHAEERYSETNENGKRLTVPVFADDSLRPGFLTRRGFTKRPGWNHHYRRDLTAPLPVSPTPGGYHIRSMGDESEHASRSWCSWRAFHSDEPDSTTMATIRGAGTSNPPRSTAATWTSSLLRPMEASPLLHHLLR